MTSSSSSLALLGAVDPGKAAAAALSPLIGWLVFVGALALVCAFVVQRERWRRFWFELEDPRSIGLFRIVFGLLVLANIHGMSDQFELLFTDEGMFDASSARQFFARRQFAGFGEPGSGDPEGFFDLAGVMRFATGPKWSALFFWDSPRAFWIHFWIFEVLVWLFIFGVFSRVTGWLAYFATLSIMHRNAVFWTGADVVFKVMFLYLVMAKNGHAYSVDNWLRRRRALRRGRCALPSYRHIPAWPRRLMIVQLCVIYLWTGCAKTGHVWSQGDSLYYALNLDHFSRVPTSTLSAVFGTNVFRLMTWVVHVWQIGFPLVLLGLVLRWANRPDLAISAAQRLRLRRCLWVVGLSAVAIMVAVVPAYHRANARLSLPWVQALIAATGVAVLVGIDFVWPKLRAGRWELRLGGQRIRIDVDFVGRWIMGRRIWLLLGAIFHLQILTLMNIGMFAPIMLAAYIACLNGGEVAALLSGLGRALSRLLPAAVRKRTERHLVVRPPLPQPTVTSRTRPGWRVPLVGVGATVVAAVASLALRVNAVNGWYWPSVGAVIGLAALAWRHRHDPRDRSLAYGPLGRTLVSLYLCAYLLALGAWAVPNKPECSSWRGPVRTALEPLLRVTNTHQTWNMFSPNPPRANWFLRVHVTDANGEVWDMMTDANSPRLKQSPWIWYSRAGKITRRIMGKPGKHYRRPYAGYWCRKWALDHGGQAPVKVELVRDSYRIPKPGSPAWNPATMLETQGRHVAFHTQWCARSPGAQLSNEVRARHGLDLVDPDTIRTRKIKRHARWLVRDQPKKKSRD